VSGSGRRRRGSGGHPARAAKRRERDQARHQSGPEVPAALARDIAETAAGLPAALDAEVWASHILGMFAAQRYGLPFPEALEIDPALMFGEPLIRRLARMDDVGAAIAVAAIAEVDDGELGIKAMELLDSAGLWRRLPRWVADMGESAIVGAAVMHDPVFGDAQTVFLQSRHSDGETLTIGVLIDHNLGGMAKDILLAESIDQVESAMLDHADNEAAHLVLERIEPGVAAGLIGQAIRLTDAIWDPPVHEDYWPGRALAQLRADQTPNPVAPPEREEMPPSERDALRAEFLSSAEGAGCATDGTAAGVASLAIEFCVGHTDGDPLRWSPVVVELFMLDWVPRKVMNDLAMVAALPGALDAWVRFAARKRGLPDWALAETLEAIPKRMAELLELLDLVDAAPTTGATRDDDLTGTILQLKITLRGVTKPPVWRRLQVPAETRLDELHDVIQAAFGWWDCHLHVFEVGGESLGPVSDDFDLDLLDERDFTLGQIVAEAGDRVLYTYDFGDDWQHDIVIEKVLEPHDGVSYPALITAKGACPHEDCGGVWGYENLKAVLADPDDEEHDEMKEWAGLPETEAFDPAAVDEETIRARLVAVRLRG